MPLELLTELLSSMTEAQRNYVDPKWLAYCEKLRLEEEAVRARAQTAGNRSLGTHTYVRASVDVNGKLVTVAPSAQGERVDLGDTSYDEHKKSPPTQQAQLRAIAERSPEPVRVSRSEAIKAKLAAQLKGAA